MAEHILHIITTEPGLFYEFVVDGTVEREDNAEFTRFNTEYDNDQITTDPDGKTRVSGRTPGSTDPQGVFGDTYRFTGTFEDVNVTGTTSPSTWTFLLDGEQMKEPGLLAFSETTTGEPPAEEPPAEESDVGAWMRDNPLLAGIAIGLIVQAILRSFG